MQKITRRQYINYDAYILSDDWKAKASAAIKRAGGHCQLCRSTVSLNVHHNTYDNLGNERDEDLIVLCRRCHEVYHVKVDPRTAPKLEHLSASIPNRIDALEPPPPGLTKRQRKEFYRLKKQQPKPPKPDPNTSGELITVTINKAYVEALITPGGGITHKALLLLGEPIPHQQGWRTRSIGRVVTVDKGELEAELSDVRAKHEGVYSWATRKSPKVKASGKTPTFLHEFGEPFNNEKTDIIITQSLLNELDCGGGIFTIDVCVMLGVPTDCMDRMGYAEDHCLGKTIVTTDYDLHVKCSIAKQQRIGREKRLARR